MYIYIHIYMVWDISGRIEKKMETTTLGFRVWGSGFRSPPEQDI